MLVSKKIKESKNVTSFYFEHIDGRPIPDNFQPGQYLAIKIPRDHHRDGYEFDRLRNYSLSCAPGQGYLRCSIGRNITPLNGPESKPYYGTVSNYMHDHVNEGDTVLVSTFLFQNILLIH